ncbi:hypothetical protein EJ05DRAFT_497093 [Pseudovirgaria hyperparasitica]|uniref:Uncharacterized protein n=1 Tax=Pseudovirgaria hyperparasitica TaxID=470096 RepID=A0A6A6WHF4_9PEZI|nr:uncharacterized protein EJ05DRAFT_497093 [Pseudovirgaria hyperparasitica]KAF2762232.1 hypothetical protein EJ05DRAFT_497093 [Pseudovirgaria hyperparasitica]
MFSLALYLPQSASPPSPPFNSNTDFELQTYSVSTAHSPRSSRDHPRSGVAGERYEIFDVPCAGAHGLRFPEPAHVDVRYGLTTRDDTQKRYSGALRGTSIQHRVLREHAQSRQGLATEERHLQPKKHGAPNNSHRHKHTSSKVTVIGEPFHVVEGVKAVSVIEVKELSHQIEKELLTGPGPDHLQGTEHRKSPVH